MICLPICLSLPAWFLFLVLRIPVLQAAPSTQDAPETWADAVNRVEGDFHRIVQGWKALRQQAPSPQGQRSSQREEDLLLQLQEAGVEASVTENTLELAEMELRGRKHELDELAARRASGVTRRAELDADVQRCSADSHAGWEALLAAAKHIGREKMVLNRAQGWWDARRALMTREAWQQDRSPETVLKQETNLEAVFNQYDEDVHLAFVQLTNALRLELDARYRLYDFEEESLSAPDDTSSLEAEIRQWTERCDSDRRRYLDAAKNVQRLRTELDEIRRGEGGRPSPLRTTFIADLDHLNNDYAYLRDWLELRPEAVSSHDWCVVHVHGGMAALLAGEDNAQELLRTGAAAYDGACLGTVFPLMDEPLFQVAWAKALFLEAGEPLIPLVVWAHNGEWTLDGQRLRGQGRIPLMLRPGLHRFEFKNVDQQRFVLVEDFRVLEEGESTQVWANPRGIDSQRVLPGVTEWAVPPPLQIEPLDPVPVPVVIREQWSQQPWGYLDTGFTWLRFDSRSHLGYGLAACWSALVRPTWQLDVGFSHHQMWGEELYRYSDSRMGSALYRERLFTRGLLLRQHNLNPSLQLAAGVIPPANALVADAALGLVWRFSPRFSLRGQGGVAATWWDLPGVDFWHGQPTGAEPWGELGLEVRL